tara:strand:- start:2158 stop:2268 length:111 start_codon:yes stop_codon:yes gene_type:complete
MGEAREVKEVERELNKLLEITLRIEWELETIVQRVN